MVLMFLAPGFEEIEAIATLDILRRCEIEALTVGVYGKTVTGSHGVTVTCDCVENDIPPLSFAEAVILPGGMPGTLNLEKSSFVKDTVTAASKAGNLVCAICAAPSILGHLGLLNGKKATCYPGFENELQGATKVNDPVVLDGNIITAEGAGAAYLFGLKIAECLKGKVKADKIKDSMLCKI